MNLLSLYVLREKKKKKTLELNSFSWDLTKKCNNNNYETKITLIPCKPVRVLIGLFAQLTIDLISEARAINPN
jgi:hypothetical protein